MYENAIEKNEPAKVNIQRVNYKIDGIGVVTNVYSSAGYTKDGSFAVIVVAHPNGGRVGKLHVLCQVLTIETEHCAAEVVFSKLIVAFHRIGEDVFAQWREQHKTNASSSSVSRRPLVPARAKT